MPDPLLSTRREIELMQQLQQAADRRASEEARITAALQAQTSEATSDYVRQATQIDAHHTDRRRQLENDYAAAKLAAVNEFDRQRTSGLQRHETARKKIAARFNKVNSAAHLKEEEMRFEALSVFDARKGEPQQRYDEARKKIQSDRVRLDGLARDALTVMQSRGLEPPSAATPAEATSAESQTPSVPKTPEPDDFDAPASPETRSALDRLESRLETLRQGVLALESQRTASWFLGRPRQIGWLVFTIGLAAVPAAWMTQFSPWPWIAYAVGAGSLAGSALLTLVVPRGRRISLARYAQLQHDLAVGYQLQQQALEEARKASQDLADEIASRRDAELAAAANQKKRTLAEAELWQKKQLDTLNQQWEELLAQWQAERQRAIAEADERYPPQLEGNAAERQEANHRNAAQRDERLDQARAEHDREFAALASRWRSEWQSVTAELAAMRDRSERFFPDWETVDFAEWQRPEQPPEAICFGVVPVPVSSVKNLKCADERLRMDVEQLLLTATMPFAEQPRMVLTASGKGRLAAVEVLQLMALRMLTAMPAGKLRLTLIDSTGLGEHFATLMHLNDYDEQITGGHVWTDPKRIDERLGVLSQHMEKVLQKYLRNEFETIHHYNQFAGEVAEPYHVVVVANFPSGFSEAAAKKLLSISTSGPRCGVYTLLSVDRDLRMPHEFDGQSLLAGAVHLDWQDERFVWQYPLFDKLQLQLDRLPPRELLNDLLRQVGQASRQASRVEVPFEVVAPAKDAIWQSDSGRELVVPVGRAGAVEKQALKLGRGTSQHVLISGKTGSGKSTLLHALITNLALHYAPDQVEFYLVDFKKGVEFKGYASGGLPHARVIAIESEREFGVSVLERLDEELRRRGELFRTHGVQDLAGFREADPQTPMPRTLLIIDEFQELFVTDDKLAQDAALLLDRLVRQGRAFGIHVLLGSQTLAGAYSLARSTIGQMAVRIALECSEADAHLILSDENTAARLLSRPGEAIYNDQNGLVAGNHPFQVVWLTDQQRQKYLSELRQRPVTRSATADPPIVFEGNVPADPLQNEALLAAVAQQGVATEGTVWLGSAVRIEPPTHLVLRRQGGHNLAVVGPQEELALGILTTAIAALHGQQHAGGAQFTILDGTRPESSDRGTWERLAAALGEGIEVVPPRGVGAVIESLSAELARRAEQSDQPISPRYLVIYDLAQFRDLRQTEDDFSFSFSQGGKDKATPIDKQFRDLLREGPAAGIHVLLWCESYNSLTRSIDRLTLREIEFRVAMQMSASDSTSLIDSPAAGQLGEHRAIFYRDDVGTQVKFRPYGRPSDAWIAALAQHVEQS